MVGGLLFRLLLILLLILRGKSCDIAISLHQTWYTKVILVYLIIKFSPFSRIFAPSKTRILVEESSFFTYNYGIIISVSSPTEANMIDWIVETSKRL